MFLRLDWKWECDGIRPSLWEALADGTDSARATGVGSVFTEPVGSRGTDRSSGGPRAELSTSLARWSYPGILGKLWPDATQGDSGSFVLLLSPSTLQVTSTAG